MPEPDEGLRLLIRAKLVDGRLPPERMARVWARPANGETCVACETAITRAQLVMESVADREPPTQFHTRCFALWQAERNLPGR